MTANNDPLSVKFKTRGFTARLARPNLKFTVNSQSFAAIGGPKEASVSIQGGEISLWDAINMLRLPVEIYEDRRGRAVWWGYVHQATVRRGALEVAVSLDSMFNRVAVAYSYLAAGSESAGERKTTAWADDLDSQGEFGIKELLSSAEGNMSDAAAEAIRDAVLTAQRWPQGGLAQTGNARARAGSKKTLGATLNCRGWWQTLGWKQANVATANTVSHTPAVTDDAGIGYDTTYSKYAQSFAVGNFSMRAISITAQYKKTNTPTDNITISLQADVNGAPSGTALASVTFAITTLTGTYAILTHVFTAAYTLPPNSTFWIVWERSGALSTNDVKLGVTRPGTYTGGKLRYYSTSDSLWHDDPGNADAYFAFNQDNSIVSTTQIQDLITQYGQFLTATDLETSGVALPSYQDGDSSALAAIEALMAAGGTNGRRLLAEVDVNRRVRIYEEPAPSTAALWMDDNAVVHESGGRLANVYQPPLGQWVRLKDVIPGVVDLTKIVDPSLQFIEESSWSAGGGAKYAFKGRPSVESILAAGQ